MICPLEFNEEQGCIKPIIGYEVNIYALGSFSPPDTLLGTFNSGSLNVPFTVTNITAVDVAAAFSGQFKNTVTVDTDILPEDVLFCYRVTSGCGTSEFCCARIISDAVPLGFILNAMPIFENNDIT